MNQEQLEQRKSLWLALDTSTPSMSVAVLDGTSILAESLSHSERNHSIRLLPSIEELMQSLGIRPSDFGGIAVGRGPGSYTGVRIAVTVAKTFAWSLGLPLVGVSSLEALAHGGLSPREAEGEPYADGVTWYVPLMDARRGQVYTAVYAAQGTKWSCLVEDGIRPMAGWVASLTAGVTEEARGGSQELAWSDGEEGKLRSPDRIVFVGETEPHQETIAKLQGVWNGQVELLSQPIRAYDIGLLGYRRFLAGETDDIHPFEPNYTQLAEAEVKWLARQQQP